MHPILFKIGPIVFYTYGFLVALGILAALYIGKYFAKLENIPEDIFEKIFIVAIIAGVIGARLFFFLYNPQYLKNPVYILFVWKGGLVWYGGLLFGILAVLYLLKRYNLKDKIWKFADIAGVSIPLGLAFGRIGCTMAGCCYGIPYNGPFAIKFTDPHTLAPRDIYLFPSQPVSSLVNFLIFLVLFYIYKKKKSFDGQIFCLFLILYGTFRFFIEFVRATPKIFFGLSENQILSLVFIFLGIILYIKLSKRKSYV